MTKNLVVSILQMLLIVFLFGLSQDYLDYGVYKNVFKSIAYGHSADYEVGYEFVNSLAANIGLDYIEFRFFLGFVFCIILFIIVRQLTEHPNFVLSCYLVFSAMFDSCLLRNAIAMILSMLSLVFFLKCSALGECKYEKNKTIVLTIILGFLFIVWTPLIHSAYWAMFLLIPLWFLVNTKKGIIKVLFLIVILYSYCVLYDNDVFYLYSNLKIRESTVNLYEQKAYSNIVGVAYHICKYILTILPILLFKKEYKTFSSTQFIYDCKHIQSPLSHSSLNALRDSFNSNILKLNIVFAAILIPQYYATNFSRIFRIIFLFNYVYLANQLKTHPVKARLIGLGYSAILAGLMFFFESPTSLDNIFFMHFKTNALFEFFDMAKNIEIFTNVRILL